MAHEINLVPDIKGEMIKALKLRNFIFFLCIVVSAGAIAIAVVFGSIAGGQSLALDSKKKTLAAMSDTVNEYRDLSDFMTLQNQVSKLSVIASNKTVPSRLFNFISILRPTNGDTIKISELHLDMTKNTMSIEAQANAETAPMIDYNVLDAFKKSMNFLTYDYGEYVDENGDTIPAYCMVESNKDGTFFTENGALYAYWMVDVPGCVRKVEEDEEGEATAESNAYEYTAYDNQRAVKIWRTPRFEEWYEAEYMNEDGVIDGVPHFESSCLGYYAETNSNNERVWKTDESKCMLIPDGEEGIRITESSNGRDSSGELVLRFSAIITFDKEIFNFNNHHAIAFGPSGKYNVTDSYLQVQKMFSERAADCANDDVSCKNGGQ